MTQYFARAVQRTNRNLTLIALGVCAASGSCAYSNRSSVEALLGSPLTLPTAKLTSIADPSHLRHQWLSVEGDRSLRIGRHYSKNRAGGSETDLSYYSALMVGNRFLLVQTTTETPESQVRFEGELKTIPADVKGAIIDSIASIAPAFAAAALPTMLDATATRAGNIVPFGIGFLGLLWGLWMVKVVVERRANPLLHPSFKQLAHYGDIQSAINAIDADVEHSSGGLSFGNAVLLNRHLLVVRSFEVYVLQLSWAVWLYQKTTQHRVNFVPTGKTYAAVVQDAFGRSQEIELEETSCHEFLKELFRRAPWVETGFAQETVQSMEGNQRAQTIRGIMQKRDHLLNQSARAR